MRDNIYELNRRQQPPTDLDWYLGHEVRLREVERRQHAIVGMLVCSALINVVLFAALILVI
jgi:hypothetical protein